MKVTIYGLVGCSRCTEVKKFFKKNGSFEVEYIDNKEDTLKIARANCKSKIPLVVINERVLDYPEFVSEFISNPEVQNA